jgi:hypothetical protein
MCVVDSVLIIGGPTVCVVIIGPPLTQLDMCGLLVPSKVCSEGPISVHVEDPRSVMLILVPLVKVFLMVDMEFLHPSLIDVIEPAKLQFTY